MNYKSLFAATWILIFASTVFAQNPVTPREESFDKVWKRVNEYHFDPKFCGVDWEKMGETYKPLALQAKTDAEFHEVLSQMLDELQLSHCGIFPAGSRLAREDVEGICGFRIKIIEDKPIVHQIDANSEAEKNGLKTGFQLTAIDGKTVTEILQPLELRLAKSLMTEQRKRLSRERQLMNLIVGKPGSQVQFHFLNAQDAEFRISVNRQKNSADYTPSMDGVPPYEMIFESKILEDRIGYIHFSIWEFSQLPIIRQAVSKMKNTDGIIIDLRGNPGGSSFVACKFAGLLCNEPTSLGTMTFRKQPDREFEAIPDSEIYQGSIVILTDYGTGCASELFIAGLQDSGRATIIGEKTTGALLESSGSNLPTRAYFQFPVGAYKSPKGVLIEKRGIMPDIEVSQTRQASIENNDLILEAGINFIKKQKG